MRRIYTALAIASLACVAVFAATLTPLAGADPGTFLAAGPPTPLIPVLMLGILAAAAITVAISAVSLTGILVHVLRAASHARRRTGMIPILRMPASTPTPHMRC